MSNSSRKIPYISLFAGCGGFDVGFEENNFKCLGSYDIDPYMTDVHSKNLKSPVFVHDLNDLNLPGNLPGKIEVVIAGSPCQGFSTIGKRVVNDPRNHLLLIGGQVAVQYNADVFVCENVPGSNSGEHKKYWDDLLKLLSKNKFRSRLVQYNAFDFGVPQLRKRLILYAWKTNKVDDLNLSPIKIRNKHLDAVFKNIAETQNHNLNFIENKSDLIIADKIGPGQKLCNVRGGERSVHTWNIPEVFGKTSKLEKEFLSTVMKLRRQLRRRKNGDADPVERMILETYFNGSTNSLIQSLLKKGYIKEVNENFIELKNTFNGKYRRLDLNSLSPTVDTRFGSYKYFLHPTDNRGLSVREAARIQGFKDTFVFYGPVKKQYEMIGNAVPPPIAHFVAKTIRDNLCY